MSETIALIDGDIFAYEVAAVSEQPVHWGNGLWTLHAHEEPAKVAVQDKVEAAAEAVGADRIIMTISDDDNWRKSILPTYKSNRNGVRRPMLLGPLKEFLKEEYETFIRPGLEADDVMGILSTWPKLKGDKIIVTKDKDMKTIPGKVFMTHRPEEGVIEVSEEEADLNHLIQALTGDATDGYSGCPGIGAETAYRMLQDPHGWEEYEHTFKSGPRKDTSEMRWRKVPVESTWEAIVSHFNKAGLCEEEALVQARVARICRASDYDFKNKRVKLWTP